MKKAFLLLIAVFTSLLFCDSASAQQSNRRDNVGSTSNKNGEKTISIDHIPNTVEEFENMQMEIATTPEGAVMMVLVAMEVYNRDREAGAQCIRLCNVENNVYSIESRLKDLFNKNDQYYSRPYQVASFFEGAKPSNGYNPTKPYTIRVRKRANRPDERSQMLRGYVKYMEVYSNGFDTPWRSCEVIRQFNDGVEDKIYKVSNCPALYTQCKELDFDSPRRYEGL